MTRHRQTPKHVVWAFLKCGFQKQYKAELANSIENAIAIAFLSTIAIAIDKSLFKLLTFQ